MDDVADQLEGLELHEENLVERPLSFDDPLFSFPGVEECLRALTPHQVVTVLSLALHHGPTITTFVDLVRQLSGRQDVKNMPQRVLPVSTYPSLPKNILDALFLVRLPLMRDIKSAWVSDDSRETTSDLGKSIPHPPEAQDEDPVESEGVFQSTRSRYVYAWVSQS